MLRVATGRGSEVLGSRVQRFRVQPSRWPEKRPVKSKKSDWLAVF
jgi:hypothetical protein